MEKPVEETPKTLEYRTPRAGLPTALRRKAWQQAFTNGVLCVGIAVLLAEPAFARAGLIWHGRVTAARAVASSAFCVTIACYLFCGVVYLVASFKIRSRNVRWERTLLWSGVGQFGVLVAAI